MRKEDMFFLADLLNRVKNPDANLKRAQAIVAREIAIYEARLDRISKARTYENDIFSM